MDIMHKIEKLFLTAIIVVGLAIGLVVSASTASGSAGIVNLTLNEMSFCPAGFKMKILASQRVSQTSV